MKYLSVLTKNNFVLLLYTCKLLRDTALYYIDPRFAYCLSWGR